MFTGNENHKISFAAAGALTEAYRLTMQPGDKKGGFFGEKAILELLSQQDCVGIRYYYGLDKNGVRVMVLVGVDADENDLVGVDNLCMEMAIPCPTECSEDNILNS